MKRKDFNDIKGKTIKELLKMAETKKTEATKKKMEIMGGKEKNLKAYRQIRAEIAKILTLVREKEILEKLEVTAKSPEVSQESKVQVKTEKVAEKKAKVEKKTK